MKKSKDFFDHLDKFIGDVERLFKPGSDKKSGLLEYDADSPFSYLTAFLRDRAVASVAPSTKYVISRVLKAMDLENARVVVEFGPAEGVMTRRILAKLPADGIVVAIELNDNFVKTLHKIRDPRLRVVHGNVAHVDQILAQQKIARADVVVSGIPFSFFKPEERGRLLQKISHLLNPNGRFVAYQFTTHLIPLLKKYFRKVDTQFEIRNLPPHFVFTCIK